MHREPAPNPLIDGLRFAESGGALKGNWPVARFARLQDAITSSVGDFEFKIDGVRDGIGRPGLRIQVSGELRLTCQRCLGQLIYPLKVDVVVLLARSEVELEARPVEPDGPDWVVAGKEMSVEALLEDEILLALPVAPRHQSCSGSENRLGEAAASPFAGLRSLLHRSGRIKN